MPGCLKSLSRKVALLFLLVAAAYAGWQWGPAVFPRIQEWLGGMAGEPGESVVSSPVLADSAIARAQRLIRGEGGDRLALGGEELTSVLRFGVPNLVPAGVVDPEVRIDDGRVHLRAQVALAAFPDLPDLGPVLGILPDTVEVTLEGSLMQIGSGEAALLVHSVEAARIPLPRRMIPQILAAMGRGDQEGLAPEAYPILLPPGLAGAYILADSLILTNDS